MYYRWEYLSSLCKLLTKLPQTNHQHKTKQNNLVEVVLLSVKKITERNTRPTAFNSHCYSTESLSCTGQRLTRLFMLTKSDPCP